MTAYDPFLVKITYVHLGNVWPARSWYTNGGITLVTVQLWWST
jgi:hypothetical protein